MPVRVMYVAPQPRTSLVGIELEREIRINLVTGKATGFYGQFEALPTPLTNEAKRLDSQPYEVQLTAIDVEAIVRLILERSGMPGTVRVDV